MAPAARLSIAGDRTIDDARVNLPDARITKAQLLHDTCTEIFDQDIGMPDERREDFFPLRRFQIQCHTFFVTVNTEKVRTFAFDEWRSPPARFVTRFRLLDFDDLCPHVAQLHRTKG